MRRIGSSNIRGLDDDVMVWDVIAPYLSFLAYLQELFKEIILQKTRPEY